MFCLAKHWKHRPRPDAYHDTNAATTAGLNECKRGLVPMTPGVSLVLLQEHLKAVFHACTYGTMQLCPSCTCKHEEQSSGAAVVALN